MNNKNKNLNKLIISCKSLKEKLPKLLNLLSEILTKQILNNPKIIKQLLADEISSYESSFVSSGHHLLGVR
ncbi:hypothetical protein HC766_03260 [Candidatus Gracilibacteria bacterium]|nr:hypothetical protein [Candidatus Gracilibacteria bacterium]